MEYFHNINRCRTIFATHLHELYLASKHLKELQCQKMKIKIIENKTQNQNQNDIVDHTHQSNKTGSSIMSSNVDNSNLSSTSSTSSSSILFLHRVESGVEFSSFGIVVAKMAGIPVDVIENATKIMKQLLPLQIEYRRQIEQILAPNTTEAEKQPKFQVNPQYSEDQIQRTNDQTNIVDVNSSTLSLLLREINDLEPDAISPQQAHQIIVNIKQSIQAKQTAGIAEKNV